MRKLLTLTLLFGLFACQSESQKGSNASSFPESIELTTSTGASIKTRVALKWKDQEQGLSGVQPEDFEDDQAVLFFNLEDAERNFWMPDTYFDLDLFYLDQNLKIIDIVRKLPHYKGRANPDLIPRARSVWSRHVLEMKSGSPISSALKIDETLQWKSEMPLTEAIEAAKKVER